MRGDLLTTETSIYEYAKQGLSHGSDRTAIWFYGRSLSYGELFEKIDNAADRLYALGVRRGCVVTIHLPNCPQAVMAIYAVAKLGGICNMVHALTPEAALRENMRFSESGLLITSNPTLAIGQTYTVDIASFMGEAARAALGAGRTGQGSGASFEALLTSAEKSADVPTQTDLSSDCAAYLHSGGTTGTPKTIMLSHSALNHCVDNTADFFEHGDMAAQVSLGVLPLFHGFGLVADVHRNIHFGSALVMMPRWNPKEAVALIQRCKVTLIVGVPAMFAALLNEPDFDEAHVSQLRYCYTGGDNVPPAMIEELDGRLGGGRRMFPGFGLTEATTMNCVNTWAHDKKGSAGYPVRDTSIAVRQEDGSLLRTGRGELAISSPTLMQGYLKDPEATAETLFFAEGRRWTRTGDAVMIDEDGFLHFEDRIKNIIIHKGYNIYPNQVESVIRAVPGVEDVCVVGVKDARTQTQNIRAAVVLQSDREEAALRSAIQTACRDALPRYSVPGEIVFMKEFPKNTIGKTDRKELARLE